jgi:hypothetical protein
LVVNVQVMKVTFWHCDYSKKIVLNHYYVHVWNEWRQYGCALYVQNITFFQYTVSKKKFSHTGNEFNESTQKNNSIWQHMKGKIGPLQGSLQIKYVGNKIEMFHEDGPNNWKIDWKLLWHHVFAIKIESEHSHTLYHW